MSRLGDLVAGSTSCMMSVWNASTQPYTLRSFVSNLRAVLIVILVLFEPGLAAQSNSVLEVRGRWVVGQDGQPTPKVVFRRGLQPSGLVYGDDHLWSVGDQRGDYAGHIFSIDPKTARLIGEPQKLKLHGAFALQEQAQIYASIRNSDFEGLSRHPTQERILFAITEDKVPWLVEIQRTDDGGGAITQLSPLQFPSGLEPWRRDTNFRAEGLTVSTNGTKLYLAFERATDNLPRILSAPVRERAPGEPVTLTEVVLPFTSVERRKDKPRARLNLNGLQCMHVGERELLLGLARDQERLLVMNPKRRTIDRVIDLVLLGPAGERIKWVSPEGLAANVESECVWIINDPDSVRGNYRRDDADAAEGRFAEFTPILFELPISALSL